MPLFDENEMYTPLALAIGDDAANCIKPLFRKYGDQSIRELAHIFATAVADVETQLLVIQLLKREEAK